MQLTAVIEREGEGYVALCPQLDIASQGETVVLARENLKEALELFFETASSEEVSRRLRQRRSRCRSFVVPTHHLLTIKSKKRQAFAVSIRHRQV